MICVKNYKENIPNPFSNEKSPLVKEPTFHQKNIYPFGQNLSGNQKTQRSEVKNTSKVRLSSKLPQNHYQDTFHEVSFQAREDYNHVYLSKEDVLKTKLLYLGVIVILCIVLLILLLLFF